MSILLTYLRPFKGRLLFLGLLLAGSIALQLLAPQVIRRFLDTAAAAAAGPALLRLGLLYMAVVLAQKLLDLAGVYFSADLGWAATNRLREDLATHTLALDLSFHKLHAAGEIIERIDGDVSALADSFAGLLVQAAGNTLLAAGILLLLALESAAVATIALLYVVATLLFMRLTNPYTLRAIAADREAHAQLAGYLEERLAGREDIMANGAVPAVMARLAQRLQAIERSLWRLDLIGGLTYHGRRLLFVLAFVLTLWLAGGAYLRGASSIGAVYLLAAYITMLDRPLRVIHRQLHRLQNALVGSMRVGQYLALQPTVHDPPKPLALPAGPLPVAFRSVSFAYRDRPQDEAEPQVVLHDISFSLPAGQTLGLLGRTGSGKSTLARLLFRLYDVDQGAILLGHTDLRRLALSRLQRDVGLVTQDVQLFAASVRHNLTFFNQRDSTGAPYSDRQLRDALRQVGLLPWLDALPQALDTPLGPGGAGLSAGEAQLLALARIFLREPRVVLLDEASSRLDPHTEQRLEQALDRLLAGRTAIVIAHRLATVQRAHRILILEEGRVLEEGERRALAADPHSRFAGLLRGDLQELLA